MRINMKTVQYNLENPSWVKNKKVYHGIIDLSNDGLVNNFKENAEGNNDPILLIKIMPDGMVNKFGYVLKPIGNNIYGHGYDGIMLNYFITSSWDEFHESLDSDKMILASGEGFGFIMEPVVLDKYELKMDLD